MTTALATIDRHFIAWTTGWSVVAMLAFGAVTAIIPNPVFGRMIPPEPFAIAVWLLSSPLMGIVAATYSSPAPPSFAPAVPLGTPAGAGPGLNPATPQGTTLGTIAGFGAFLAIGCPICNKIALILLGTSGALSIYAPLQPIIGVVSLALLAGTIAWRFRLRVRGACAV